MRFLDTYTGRFVEKDPRKEEFKYAILSHTWDGDREQTHKELKKIQKRYEGEYLFTREDSSHDLPPSQHEVVSDDTNDVPLQLLSAIWKDPELSPKIQKTCEVARKNGYRYVWVDSCCIDKTSSSELSEAINSMFSWYQRADVCYAYLVDVPPRADKVRKEEENQGLDADKDKDTDADADQNIDQQLENGSASKEIRGWCSGALRASRWFKRGWTLQELLAPKNLVFLSQDWAVLGSKEDLAELVNAITRISIDALSNRRSLSEFSVAQRLSWAAKRETTRVEDRAYSLLGIFDINMPILYGEGEGAFQRLQEEILKCIPDQSIFGWGTQVYLYGGVLQIQVGEYNDHTTRIMDHNCNIRTSLSYRVTSAPELATSLLATSPDSFVNSQNIEVAPVSQLFPYYYPDLPASDYTFTPLGIRTHFPLIPLSALKLRDASELELESPNLKWYIAVLGCQHVDHPGQLLGRVCYEVNSFPLFNSGISVLYRGVIISDRLENTPAYRRGDRRGRGDLRASYTPEFITSPIDLIALPAEILVHSSPLATVYPIYLLKPGSVPKGLSDFYTIKHPHKTINLLLKTEAAKPHSSPPPQIPHHTLDQSILRPGTYLSADERTMTKELIRPNRDNPNTHSLIISEFLPMDRRACTPPEFRDFIIIKYTHKLEDDGNRLIIEVHISGMGLGHPIIHVTSTWRSNVPWEDWEPEDDEDQGPYLWNGTRRVLVLDNGEGGMAEVVLSLEYLATNHYLIDAYTTWFHKRPIPESEDGSTRLHTLSEDHTSGMSEDRMLRRAAEDSGAQGMLEDHAPVTQQLRPEDHLPVPWEDHSLAPSENHPYVPSVDHEPVLLQNHTPEIVEDHAKQGVLEDGAPGTPRDYTPGGGSEDDEVALL